MNINNVLTLFNVWTIFINYYFKMMGCRSSIKICFCIFGGGGGGGGGGGVGKVRNNICVAFCLRQKIRWNEPNCVFFLVLRSHSSRFLVADDAGDAPCVLMFWAMLVLLEMLVDFS